MATVYHQKNRSANKARGFHLKRQWTLVCKQIIRQAGVLLSKE